MTAGYSGKPLVEKLGIKPGWTITILNAPRGYDRTLGKVPARVTRRIRAAGALDFIQFFTGERRDLEHELGTLARALAPAGALWLCGPQGPAGVPTDIPEDVRRTIG